MSASMAMGRLRYLLSVLVIAAAAGCHHVIIDNGLAPSETAYHEEWNLAFAAAIFPATVDGSEMCAGYFSEVQTRHSFLNLVVSLISIGIISPMETRITCAQLDQQDSAAREGPRHGGAGARAVNVQASGDRRPGGGKGGPR